MNVKYGVPVLFISCGIFVLLLNILGNRTSFKEPKPFHRNNSRKEVSKGLLDLKNFTYVISPKCRVVNLIWIVTSYAGDISERSALRRAYNTQELEQLGIQRIFLLGKLDSNSERKSQISQAAIDDESNKFQDILQGNFFEAYRNLTYKHLMGLKWIVESCEEISYIMKMDDDIVINLYEILNVMKEKNINNSIAGYVLDNMKPKREPANKWYVTQEEFEPEFYPKFISGWMYVTSYPVVVKLIENLQFSSKYFWIDDVFVTGLLRKETDIELIDVRNIFTTDFGFLKCCIKNGRKGFKCEFAVGPNGGDTELQIRFQEFSKVCQSNCKSKSIKKSCVLAYKEKNLGEGSAQIRPINIF